MALIAGWCDFKFLFRQVVFVPLYFTRVHCFFFRSKCALKPSFVWEPRRHVNDTNGGKYHAFLECPLDHHKHFIPISSYILTKFLLSKNSFQLLNISSKSWIKGCRQTFFHHSFCKRNEHCFTLMASVQKWECVLIISRPSFVM